MEELPNPLDDDTVSATPDEPIDGIPFIEEETGSLGDLIDAQIEEPAKPVMPDGKDSPKSGPPTITEWQGFFSRIVIKLLTDGYLSLAFRGIDEEALTVKDLQKLKLTDAERGRIAVPFAEYANKSKIARKHGRKIVAAADSFESIATLAIWMGRVNRVARKYRKTDTRKTGTQNVSTGPAEQNGHGHGPVPTEGLIIQNPYA